MAEEEQTVQGMMAEALRGNNIALGLMAEMREPSISEEAANELLEQVLYVAIETAAVANRALYELNVRQADESQTKIMEDVRKSMVGITHSLLENFS